MKTLKTLTLFLLVIFVSCSSSSSTSAAPTGDPYRDSERFANECVAAARENDFDKINELCGELYEYYREQDLADRVSFAKAMQSDEYFSEEDARFWDAFVENERFDNLPNVIRLNILIQDTKKEAKERGVWNPF